jgi:hypothetical protein
MPCLNDRIPVYVPHSNRGIKAASNKGDGYTISIEWNQAFAKVDGDNIAYNIYYSSVRDDVFSEGVKYVSVRDGYFAASISGFTPGKTYYFGVKATEYDPSWYNLSLLPKDGDLHIYPETVLTSNISEFDTIIPIADINEFPAYGIIKIGTELIRYTSKDIPTGSLIVTDPFVNRGFLNTTARPHNVDGYDGRVFQDPIVYFWEGIEDTNVVAFQATASFTYPNFPRTNADGYRVRTKDILTSDLSASDASQQDFPAYDYTGWHRTDPVAMLEGKCIGTYYGGEQFCADGYLGVGRMIRGVPLQSENHRRQEVLLEVTGEPCVLLRRMRTDITCSCYVATTEYPDDRCPYCAGTGFVSGFDQFFNPRRSDGRILVRFSATDEDLAPNEGGLESILIPECWTLVVPAIKDRDYIIRFNEDGTEEFRYEITKVARNKLINSFSGGQKFTAQRVRKTDPIYQVNSIYDTSKFPEKIVTSIGMVSGPGGILPHTHEVVVNEGIVSLVQINQTTSISQDHNHPVINGVVQEVLGHTHKIIL